MDKNKIQQHLNTIFNLLNTTDVRGGQNMANIVNSMSSVKEIQKLIFEDGLESSEDSENDKQ